MELDLKKFTFSGTLIASMSELLFEQTFKDPLIQDIVTMYPGIKTRTEMGFVGRGGKVGVKSTGCSPKAEKYNVNTRLAVFDPQEWEVLLKGCYQDLLSTAAVYSMRTGTSIADYTETDYMNIMLIVLAESMRMFVIRTVFFGDKQAAETLTNKDNAKYYTLFDGLFKQAKIVSLVNTKQLVSTQQLDEAADPVSMMGHEDASAAIWQAVQKVLVTMFLNAPVVLRGLPNQRIYCTQAFYDLYAVSLQNLKLPQTYINLREGLDTLSYNGIPLYPIKSWDAIIAEDDLGYSPYLFLYTTPEVLGVAVDSEDSLTNVDIWYNRDDRAVKAEAMGKMDAQLMAPDLFVLGVADNTVQKGE